MSNFGFLFPFFLLPWLKDAPSLSFFAAVLGQGNVDTIEHVDVHFVPVAELTTHMSGHGSEQELPPFSRGVPHVSVLPLRQATIAA